MRSLPAESWPKWWRDYWLTLPLIQYISNNFYSSRYFSSWSIIFIYLFSWQSISHLRGWELSKHLVLHNRVLLFNQSAGRSGQAARGKLLLKSGVTSPFYNEPTIGHTAARPHKPRISPVFFSSQLCTTRVFLHFISCSTRCRTFRHYVLNSQLFTIYPKRTFPAVITALD